MKSLVSSYCFTPLSLLFLVMCCFSSASISANNRVDEEGLRQGYWIITGNMTNEKGFSSSSVVEEGAYKDDLKTGIWKKYYPTGELRSEITFTNNRPIGDYWLYFKNGVLEEKGNWQRTKNIGEFIRNYENGNPHQKFLFSDSGKRNGIQLYYHSNGNLALEVEVINGQETGVMKRYDEDGNLSEERTFEKGKYLEGTVKNHGTTQEKYEPKPVEPKTGEDISTTTAQPSSNEEPNAAHHFKPNGHNILYNKNKQISQTGVFKEGRLWNGKWYKYNINGILIRVDVYRNGKFIGHGIIEEE